MSLSDNIAEVALVVSLVALIISGLQLLSQLFLTSEGWSRCGPLVIGQWSLLRRSRWLWTEMRYETKFVTPRILVVHGNSDLDSKTEVAELFRKRSWRSYWLLQSPTHIHEQPHSVVKFWDKNLDTYSKATSKSLKAASSASSHFKTKFAVTWPELIHNLGRYYYLQVENVVLATDSGTSAEPRPHDGMKEDLRLEKIVPDKNQAQRLSLLSSVVGLKLEEHSWDAMPPDAVRPMATISLGHLIIIAIRFGMRWRRISLFDGLQATGVIGSVSSAMIHGLGTVALFNFTSADFSTRQFRLLVPSKNADKLMCGIIPATLNLGICTVDGKDIPLVDDARSLKPMKDFLRYDVVRKSYRASKEEEKLMDTITSWHRPNTLEWYFRSAVFDAWCMLCPFIPVERSPVNDIILPLPGEHMRTPLNYAGGRRVLSLLFRAKFQPRAENDTNAEWVNTLLGCFDILDTKFNASKSRFQSSSNSAYEIVGHTDLLRDIHQKSSQQLILHNVIVPPLVGVHVLTVISAAKKALKNWNDDLDEVDGSFLIQDCIPRDLLNQDRLHLLAYCYADEIVTWTRYARDREPTLMQSLGSDGELLWWTLVLRAMSWALSVRVNLTYGSFAYEPVPSSLYGDPTPIWIM